MFKKNKSAQPKKIETIIGPNIKVKGNFNGEGNTVIEGVLEGSLKTSGEVYVGDNAKILANIKAKTIRLGGVVTGDIYAQKHLEVVSSAKISGNIQCSSLSVESGATLNGQCTMFSAGETEEKENKTTPKNKKEKQI